MTTRAKALTFLGIPRRNLYRQPVRSVLTAIGVAIGVASIISVGAAVLGVKNSINNAIQTSGNDLMIGMANTPFDIFGVLKEDETRAVLAADPDVEASSAALWHFFFLDDPAGAIAFTIGVRPEEFGVQSQEPIRGVAFSNQDEVMLGVGKETELDKTVGDEISLKGRTYRVAGIFRTGVPFLDKAVVMHLDRLQEITVRADAASIFYVRLKPGVDKYEFVDRFECDHPQYAAIADANQYGKIDIGMNMMDEMVWLLSSLATLIGGLIVANTMWMAVNHRTREIGVFRALGWSRRNVMLMIIIEALYLGLFAWILGATAGVALAETSAHLPFVDMVLAPCYDFTTLAISFGAAVLLSAFGAAIPALRAASISPAEALRYE